MPFFQARAFSCLIESEGDYRIGLVLIHAFCRQGGWRAWPDPYPLTFADVSLAQLRADCRVGRRLSDLASAPRARSGGGPWDGAGGRARSGRGAMFGPTPGGAPPHSQRIEAHAELILSAVAAKTDITLSE